MIKKYCLRLLFFGIVSAGVVTSETFADTSKPGSAIAQTMSSNTEKHESAFDAIRSWNIKRSKKQQIPKRRKVFVSDCTDYHNSGIVREDYFLTRPGEKNFVAIMRLETYRAPSINPEIGFDYGPIPLLEEMTIDQFDCLWGPGQKGPEESKDSRTYKLSFVNAKSVTEEVLINCIFKDNHIQKYQILGPELKNTGWVKPIPFL